MKREKISNSQEGLSGSTAGSIQTVVVFGIGVGLLYEGSIIQLGRERGGWLVDGAPTIRSRFTVEILVVFRLRSYLLSNFCINWFRTVNVIVM